MAQISVMGIVVSLIMVAAMIGVGAIVFQNFFETLDAMDAGATGNATIDTIGVNTWAAFDLAALLPLVIGAGAVIAGLVMYLTFRAG